jgi:hypothetical protein
MKNKIIMTKDGQRCFYIQVDRRLNYVSNLLENFRVEMIHGISGLQEEKILRRLDENFKSFAK